MLILAMRREQSERGIANDRRALCFKNIPCCRRLRRNERSERRVMARVGVGGFMQFKTRLLSGSVCKGKARVASQIRSLRSIWDATLACTVQLRIYFSLLYHCGTYAVQKYTKKRYITIIFDKKTPTKKQ